MLSKPKNQFERRAKTLERRNKIIYNDFVKQYNGQRIRYDDCIELIADKHFLSKATIDKIFKTQSKLQK